jgi:hypothetical protein
VGELKGGALPGLQAVPSKVTPVEDEELATTEGRTMILNVTLLDLVNAVSQYARGEGETIAAVVYMVNSGRVRLCGTFEGARFDLRTLEARPAAA